MVPTTWPRPHAPLQRAEEEDRYEDDLNAASNGVLDLVKAGKLEEAKVVACSLLSLYSDVHDGWDRLGMVHETRGNAREAADSYRKVLDFLEQDPATPTTTSRPRPIAISSPGSIRRWRSHLKCPGCSDGINPLRTAAW